MMPSVIPARLQFQCGHAALVTLPRVKGETATQRNDRVAREKSAALSRQCDFCAPANGNNHVVEVLEVDIPVTEMSPLDAPVEELIIAQAPTFEALTSDTPALQTSHTETSSVEASNGIAEPDIAPATVEVSMPELEGAEISAAADEAKPARKLRTRRAPSAAEVARGQRFLVEYRWERVVRADTIHDALRQLATSGAEDVVEITRL